MKYSSLQGKKKSIRKHLTHRENKPEKTMALQADLLERIYTLYSLVYSEPKGLPLFNKTSKQNTIEINKYKIIIGLSFAFTLLIVCLQSYAISNCLPLLSLHSISKLSHRNQV